MLTAVIAFSVSGSAVSERDHDSEHSAQAGQTVRVARSETCRSARNGLRWYRARQRDWLSKKGVEYSWKYLAQNIPRKPRSCSDARYLAQVAKRRSFAARLAYERWVDAYGATINRLERGMRGTPMMGTGAILERWGRRYGVSPYFMVAVAATESSIGVAACSNNRRNVWGLASCVNSWPVPYFNTWDAAISFYAHFLSSRWPGHSTPYSFRGYAACSDCWARKVSYWMNALFGVPAVTRYP